MKLLLTILLFCGSAFGQVFEARAVRATDGDTLEFKHSDGNADKCRLLGIDAPEMAKSSKEIDQPYAKKCRDILSNLITNQTITIETTRRDSYGRVLARALLDDLDLNLFMLKVGCAWSYYPKFQFHIGSIKNPLYFAFCNAKSGFNSTLVQLKR